MWVLGAEEDVAVNLDTGITIECVHEVPLTLLYVNEIEVFSGLPEDCEKVMKQLIQEAGDSLVHVTDDGKIEFVHN